VKGWNPRSAGRAAAAVAAIGIASLAVAAPAGARKATIGPKDLSPPALSTATCVSATCTLTTGSAPGIKLKAPFGGKITRWKVRTGEPHDAFANDGPVRLQVLTRTVDQPGFLDDEFETVRETVNKPVEPGAVTTFNTKLRIRKGQLIGLASVDDTEISQGTSEPGATYLRFDTALIPGDPVRTPDAAFGDSYWLFNAKVER
jgi:hypothetical protein